MAHSLISYLEASGKCHGGQHAVAEVQDHLPGFTDRLLRSHINYPPRREPPALQVMPLAPEQIEDQLKMAVADLTRRPAAMLQSILDHFHGSYAQELAAAAAELQHPTRKLQQ